MHTLKRLFDIASFANSAGQTSLEEVANSSEGEELKRLEPPELIEAQLTQSEILRPHER